MKEKHRDTPRKAALFDFDGVVADTEPIYDLFWNDAAIRYGLGIDNFTQLIKGTTLPIIMEKYLSGLSEETRQQVIRESSEFDQTMPLPPMPGSLEFIRMLKEHGVQTGLVTSSDSSKMERACKLLGLENLFDTIVTADRITKGKPDPMCYLLAAEDLQVAPEDCVVFEDSFNGIAAGASAGMRVIGLSTTNPVESLRDKVYEVIPNLEHITFEDYMKW